MRTTYEQARGEQKKAAEHLRERYGLGGEETLDALWLTGRRKAAFGVAGLPFPMPVCRSLRNSPELSEWWKQEEDQLVVLSGKGKAVRCLGDREVPLTEAELACVLARTERCLKGRGELLPDGSWQVDLMAGEVGSHFAVNLLLGDRRNSENPLFTTPKSAVDALGRGSFRATGAKQVLATRYVLNPYENGEPANRQFYLVEDGRQIFYSANVHEHVTAASCVHRVNRTEITYRLDLGLDVRRTIFLLPQREGLPTAVEAQRIEIMNRGGQDRTLTLVGTGVFGIAGPDTVANDVVYANIVAESEIWYRDGAPMAVSLHHKPWDCQGEKRFAMLLSGGEGMEGFCTHLQDFVGTGDLAHPDFVSALPNTFSQKWAPFFAMSKTVTIPAGGTAEVDFLVGMTEDEKDAASVFPEQMENLIRLASEGEGLEGVLKDRLAYWDHYRQYLVPHTGDAAFDAYTGNNLPFQVLYQTYVSRAFAWTQKSFRETGFREIQDIFASMAYLHAAGEDALIRSLLSCWIENVFRMGYANHDFTFRGKGPGDCSDDQLWLTQAVYRYVMLTGDTDFLRREFRVAGEEGTRSLLETLMATLEYSGKISVGAHGFPLLDKADWNDTLRLDHGVMQGPEKEKAYRAQLAETGESWGAPFRNTQSESIMNACLLLIAADEIREMADMMGSSREAREAGSLADSLRERLQRYAWKGNYFARCLMNDDRPYKVLGAAGDGLSLTPEVDGSFYLNSYSWPILAEAADEEQIGKMLDVVEKYLKTEAGLKLCTLVNYEALGVHTGTDLYFPGDRENGGVFKHAAMMATVASLKAARKVKDEGLAARLRDLAFFMIDRTLPYKTMENPYVLKGNPRFCTQYNNSMNRENVGPMLSGTASWLTLAVYEMLGWDMKAGRVDLSPVLRAGTEHLAYTVNLQGTRFEVTVEAQGGAFRAGAGTERLLDGTAVTGPVILPADGGCHTVQIRL